MSAHNPLQRLRDLGQSVWYDYIRRDLITTGRILASLYFFSSGRATKRSLVLWLGRS